MSSSGARILFLWLVATLISWTDAAPRQEETPKKTLFLPKNPIAAAYLLNRLSNQELIEAPRSEFVYVALLQRQGLDRKFRREALEGLAKARKTEPLAELTGGVTTLATKGAEGEPVLRDLCSVLLPHKTAQLAAKRTA